MAENSAPNHAGTKAYRVQWIKAFEAGWEAALNELESENARLKEALAWYGQEWLYDIKEFVCAATLSIAGELPKQETIQGNPIQHDRGKRARAALEGGE
jgi:hypothetical protein